MGRSAGSWRQTTDSIPGSLGEKRPSRRTRRQGRYCQNKLSALSKDGVRWHKNEVCKIKLKLLLASVLGEKNKSKGNFPQIRKRIILDHHLFAGGKSSRTHSLNQSLACLKNLFRWVWKENHQRVIINGITIWKSCKFILCQLFGEEPLAALRTWHFMAGKNVSCKLSDTWNVKRLSS